MGLKYYKRVWSLSKQKGSHKLTMLAIAELTNEKTGQCNPSHGTLADMVGVSCRQIRKILDELTSAGEIEVTSFRGRTHTNQYTILLGENRNPSSYFNEEIPLEIPTGDEENRNSSAASSGEVPILDGENRNPSSYFNEKTGAGARENRNSSSYEPREPINTLAGESATVTATTWAAFTDDPEPARQPGWSGNVTKSKAVNEGQAPPGQLVRKGTGKTPYWILREYTSRPMTKNQIDLTNRTVTDLELWRKICETWDERYGDGWNKYGHLDWYRNGIPGPNGKTATVNGSGATYKQRVKQL